MAHPRGHKATSSLVTLVAMVGAIAVLHAAKGVLIPIALAILLSFLLAPLVIRLQHLGLGRVLSVIIVATLSFAFIGLLGWVVAGQTIDVANELPNYRSNIRAKISAIKGPSDGVLGRATRSIMEITKEVAEATTQPAEGAATQSDAAARGRDAPGAEPVPVEVVSTKTNPFEAIASAAAPVLGPLVSAGIVVVFVIFMLIQREDLRDRVIHLIGEGQLTVTTKAIDDAARRVSRYLVALLVVNSTYGLAVAAGLYFIGLPNAILWGVIAALLRFIPYVGPWIGAAVPTLLSLAVFDDWTRPLLTAGLFVVIELLSNNVLEPLIYGSKTGLTPVAVLISAVFWAWLWGPVGLMLATPLTVCLVVIGRYVPRLEFLSVMLGDQPSLSLEARIYQRLLAMDQDEVYTLAEGYLKEHSLHQLYEAVLIPTLSLAERDRHHGTLEPARVAFVYHGMRDLVETLGERDRARAADASGGSTPRSVATPVINGPILCLPARDEADEIVAVMLAQLLRANGARAEAIGVEAMTGEVVEAVEREKPAMVFISALPPLAVMHSRYLCKRLFARMADLKVVVGLWNSSNPEQARERIRTCGTDRVISSLSQAAELIRS